MTVRSPSPFPEFCHVKRPDEGRGRGRPTGKATARTRGRTIVDARPTGSVFRALARRRPPLVHLGSRLSNGHGRAAVQGRLTGVHLAV